MKDALVEKGGIIGISRALRRYQLLFSDALLQRAFATNPIMTDIKYILGLKQCRCQGRVRAYGVHIIASSDVLARATTHNNSRNAGTEEEKMRGEKEK